MEKSRKTQKKIILRDEYNCDIWMLIIYKKGGLGIMESYIKIKPRVLMKIIASILITIMILQFFPAIVFGIQQSNTLQNNDNIVENEADISTEETQIVGEF